MATTKKTTVSITGSAALPLEDLRWLVKQTLTLPDDTTVRVTYSQADPRDPRERDSVTLTLEMPL